MVAAQFTTIPCEPHTAHKVQGMYKVELSVGKRDIVSRRSMSNSLGYKKFTHVLRGKNPEKHIFTFEIFVLVLTALCY